jgi:hypothetical protein
MPKRPLKATAANVARILTRAGHYRSRYVKSSRIKGYGYFTTGFQVIQHRDADTGEPLLCVECVWETPRPKDADDRERANRAAYHAALTAAGFILQPRRYDKPFTRLPAAFYAILPGDYGNRPGDYEPPKPPTLRTVPRDKVGSAIVTIIGETMGDAFFDMRAGKYGEEAKAKAEAMPLLADREPCAGDFLTEERTGQVWRAYIVEDAPTDYLPMNCEPQSPRRAMLMLIGGQKTVRAKYYPHFRYIHFAAEPADIAAMQTTGHTAPYTDADAEFLRAVVKGFEEGADNGGSE